MSDTRAIHQPYVHQDPFPAKTDTFEYRPTLDLTPIVLERPPTTPSGTSEHLPTLWDSKRCFNFQRKNTLSAIFGEAPHYLVAQAKTNESATDSELPVQIEIDLSNIESVTTLGLKLEQREMDTPAYQEKKSFTGYKLADVLNAMHPDLKNLKNPDQYKVTFVCSDGYKAVAETAKGITPLSAILSGNDFAATGIESPGKWDVVNEGWMAGLNKIPAPFYIMGDSITTETWPLMVVKVVIEKVE